MPDCPDGNLGTGAQTKFAPDARKAPADAALRDPELVSDLSIGQPLHYARHDLQLTRRQFRIHPHHARHHGRARSRSSSAWRMLARVDVAADAASARPTRSLSSAIVSAWVRIVSRSAATISSSLVVNAGASWSASGVGAVLGVGSDVGASSKTRSIVPPGLAIDSASSSPRLIRRRTSDSDVPRMMAAWRVLTPGRRGSGVCMARLSSALARGWREHQRRPEWAGLDRRPMLGSCELPSRTEGRWSNSLGWC